MCVKYNYESLLNTLTTLHYNPTIVFSFGIVHVRYIHNRQESHCIHLKVSELSLLSLIKTVSTSFSIIFASVFLTILIYNWVGFDVVLIFFLLKTTFVDLAIFIWWQFYSHILFPISSFITCFDKLSQYK